jgi:hypothetical protein
METRWKTKAENHWVKPPTEKKGENKIRKTGEASRSHDIVPPREAESRSVENKTKWARSIERHVCGVCDHARIKQ